MEFILSVLLFRCIRRTTFRSRRTSHGNGTKIISATEGKVEYTEVMEKRIYYQVKDSDLPCVVREALRTRLGLSEHQVRSAKFRPGGICVNQMPARVNTPLASADVVEILLEQKDILPGNLEAVSGPLDILYEDEDLLAVNKPAGTALHPAHGHYRDTLSNYVLWYYKEQGISTEVRSIGRLDKDTSGVVLFAKNQVAAARLWEKGRLRKEYLALAAGHLKEKQGCVEKPIGKKAEALNEMELSHTGKYAKTYYRILEEYRDCSLVWLTLETGRTHQIRIHMASLGHPLLGDSVYGKCENDGGICRTALHCGRMVLQQPFTGTTLEIQAPLPADMRKVIQEHQEEGEDD